MCLCRFSRFTVVCVAYNNTTLCNVIRSRNTCEEVLVHNAHRTFEPLISR